jgi:hypothetical protein
MNNRKMSLKKNIFIFILALLIDNYQSCENTCEDGWINNDDLCYKFYSNLVVKENARCPSGSSLVTVFTKETFDFVTKIMNEQHIQSIWLDAKLDDKTMTYKWSNSTQVNNSFWCNYFPSFSQFRCVVLTCLTNEQYCLQDRHCDYSIAAFVCQKKL